MEPATEGSTATSLQLLIRRADHDDAAQKELQNLGRAVRANLVGAIVEAREIDQSLKDWKFGELLSSIEGEREGDLAAEASARDEA